jgi:hypothetical protein
VRLIVLVLYRLGLSFDAVVHFYSSRKCFCCIKYIVIPFMLFGFFFIFLLLVFHKFLEPNRHFPLKMVSGVFLLFYWPHVITKSGIVKNIHAYLPA